MVVRTCRWYSGQQVAVLWLCVLRLAVCVLLRLAVCVPLSPPLITAALLILNQDAHNCPHPAHLYYDCGSHLTVRIALTLHNVLGTVTLLTLLQVEVAGF